MRCAIAVLLLALPTTRVLADDTKAKTFEVEIVKDVAYVDKDADKERHKLDMYLPKGEKNYPVLFFIHGGGWRNGNKSGFGGHGKTFASHGIGFVAINYRLSPAVKHPEHIKDVAKAFAFAHADLKKRGADVGRIYVSGHSAGGHLCALLACDESHLKEHKLALKDIKMSLTKRNNVSINPSGFRLTQRGEHDTSSVLLHQIQQEEARGGRLDSPSRRGSKGLGETQQHSA